MADGSDEGQAILHILWMTWTEDLGNDRIEQTEHRIGIPDRGRDLNRLVDGGINQKTTNGMSVTSPDIRGDRRGNEVKSMTSIDHAKKSTVFISLKIRNHHQELSQSLHRPLVGIGDGHDAVNHHHRFTISQKKPRKRRIEKPFQISLLAPRWTHTLHQTTILR